MKSNTQLIGLLAVSSLKGIGPAFIHRYINTSHFISGNLQEEIENILAVGKKKFDVDEVAYQIDNAYKIYSETAENNIQALTVFSDEYPSQLKVLKDAPPVIFLKGNLKNLHSNTVCIIGTREPDDIGKEISKRVGRYFSENNWSICNGLAEGIDTFSIKDGTKYYENVIGILAGGLNYNSSKTLLKSTAANADKILENNGLLISEMPLNKKEDTFSVVKSCRIQAGMSDGLLLVQSSLTGGSKYTVKAFAEHIRPLAVINPISDADALQFYEANIEIIHNFRKGIAEMTELKPEKIAISSFHTIRSKDDYVTFEKSMLEAKKSSGGNNTLF